MTLSLILGSLILIVGTSGILITQKLAQQIEKMSDSAFGPALAFDEIIHTLNRIEIELLKSQMNSLPKAERNRLLDNIDAHIQRIQMLKNIQLEKNRGGEFGEDLTQWDRNWSTFERKIFEFITLEKNARSSINVGNLDSHIISLREDMSRIRDLIKHEVVAIIENSTVLTKWSFLFLLLTLTIGAAVALLATTLIVRHIKKLFLEAEESKKRMELLFNNLDEGFLIFDRTGLIHKGVSDAAAQIFGKEIVGKKFIDILPLDASKKKQAEAWLELAFSGTYDFDDFKSVAPRSIQQGGRYIEFDFRPIYASDQSLDRIICISVDKTNEKKLREIAEEETALVKLVTSMIKDHQGFASDIKEIRNLLQIIYNELSGTTVEMSSVLRGIHTVKGCAATRYILSVAKLAHSFETKVAGHFTSSSFSNPELLMAELKRDVKNIENVFEAFMKTNEKVFEALMGKENSKTKTIDINKINELCLLLVEQSHKDSPALNYFNEHFMRDNIVLSFAHYADTVTEIAKRQKKKVEVQVLNSEFSINPEPYQALFATFSHVFTNAIDHGIETETERRKAGKNPTGLIAVSFKKNTTPAGETLLIQITDDGRGMNWEEIRNRAVAKAIVDSAQAHDMSSEECLQLIFESNFSTRDLVTDTSGRGVGTNALFHEAKKLGGRAWVKSQLGKGTSFFIEVPNYDKLVLSGSRKTS